METENRLEIAQGREKTGIASEWGDFPAGPVVKTTFQCRDMGSIPGQGSKVPHAMAYGQNFFKIKKKTVNVYEGSHWGDGNDLQLIYGDSCTTW